MIWIKRITIATPFFIAGLLQILGLEYRSPHLHPQRVGGYAFLFGTPWAWLFDGHSWLTRIPVEAVILWISASLYSLC
jgi:hypothetical protein